MCRVVKKTQSQLISIILNTSNRVEGSPSLTCLYRERDINTREARSTHRSRCCGGCTGRTRGRGCCGIDNNNGIGGKGNGGGETIELDSLLLRLPSEINCISRPRRRRRFTGGSQFHLNSLSEKGIFFLFSFYILVISFYLFGLYMLCVCGELRCTGCDLQFGVGIYTPSIQWKCTSLCSSQRYKRGQRANERENVLLLLLRERRASVRSCIWLSWTMRLCIHSKHRGYPRQYGEWCCVMMIRAHIQQCILDQYLVLVSQHLKNEKKSIHCGCWIHWTAKASGSRGGKKTTTT